MCDGRALSEGAIYKGCPLTVVTSFIRQCPLAANTPRLCSDHHVSVLVDFAPGMTDAALQQPFANYLPVQAADAADTPCIVPGSVRSMATDDAGPVRRSKPMRCHACNIDFDGLAALRQHNTKQHDGVNTYLCPHCDSRFNSNSQLLTHITKKHGDAPILGPVAQQGVPAAKAGGPAKAAAAQDVASQHTESSVDPMETGENSYLIFAAASSCFLPLLTFNLRLPPRCERHLAAHLHLVQRGAAGFDRANIFNVPSVLGSRLSERFSAVDGG